MILMLGSEGCLMALCFESEFIQNKFPFSSSFMLIIFLFHYAPPFCLRKRQICCMTGYTRVLTTELRQISFSQLRLKSISKQTGAHDPVARYWKNQRNLVSDLNFEG